MVKRIAIQLMLVVLLPVAVKAGQQPTQPGWPQPVENERWFGYGILNQNELRTGEGPSLYRWDGEGWYGGNLNRAWFKSEGNLELDSGALNEAEVQALYSRAISPFFNLQVGVRYDFEPTPSRTYGAFGVEGLAPMFVEVGAFGFVSNGGHYAARLEGHYDMRLTQRLILQPQFEANFYTASERDRGIGSGFSDLDAGLRLRYEIRRQFAPYIGVTYQSKFGQTADFARADGESVSAVRFVVGLRVWY
jgi:copper resistance protein B